MLTSPRLRRRLAKLTLAVAFVGAVVGTFVAWPNTADSEKYTSQVVDDSPAVAPAKPEDVALSASDRDAALATAKRFLRTAVVREHLDESWPLVHPDLRQGLSRSEWNTGDIPVTPYPVDSARWRLGYSHAGAIGLEVYVLPKVGSDVRNMVFDLELKSRDGRWLVSSWSPRGGGLFATPPQSPERVDAAARAQDGWDAARLPVGLLLLPVSVVAAAVALPLFLVLRERRRRGAAERSFSEHRAQRLGARDDA